MKVASLVMLIGLDERAKVENLHPYILRHTFASRYLEANPGDLVGLAPFYFPRPRR